MEIQQVKRITEAALLAAGQPLALTQLSALFADTDVVASDAIVQALNELQAEYAGRGVELIEVASGFRFQVREDVHPWVARLWTERQTRYSRALLETLALVAYRQPITRAEIEQIRGVAVSTNIIRTLEEREWVRVVGHRDVPGKPALFGTTRQFLDYFNLKSLDQLPALAEIRDIEEFEPQLALSEGGSVAALVDAANALVDAREAGSDHDSEAEFGVQVANPPGPGLDGSAASNDSNDSDSATDSSSPTSTTDASDLSDAETRT